MTKFNISNIVLLLTVFVRVYAQELPPVENYSPENYEAGNQNWSISQGNDRTMYFANNSGLLEFNGSEWRLYVTPNGSIVRAVNVINDVIYTGSFMDFGFWKRNSHGILEYTTLKSKLDTPLVNDEDFWEIVQLDEWVLFRSFDRIYIYNTTTEVFNIIETDGISKIVKIENQIYFQKTNQGLFRIVNGQSSLISDAAIFKDNLMVGAFSVGNKNLFVFENGQFYYLNNQELEKWEIPADNELKTKRIYSSIKLSDGSFLLGTISDGIILVDTSGTIVTSINREKGLYNNTILSVFEDLDHNIWLGLDNGISTLNFDAPFKVYNDFNGDLGVIYTSINYKNNLYLGTNQGLFYKPLNSSESFQLVEQTEGQVWTLKVFNNTLFCGHNRGTFIIDQEQPIKLISSKRGTWDIKAIPNSDYLLQGNYDGLSVLEKDGSSWKFRNNIEGFDISSRFFEFVDDQTILVNHEINGVYTLELDTSYLQVTNLKSQGAYGFGSSLVKFNDDILYSINSIRAIFKYDEEQLLFVNDTALSRVFYTNEDAIIGPLVKEVKSQKLWGFTSKSITYYGKDGFSDGMIGSKIPISPTFRRTLGLVGFENITYYNDNKYLIGSSNGYVVLDLNKIDVLFYDIQLTEITKETRSGELASLDLTSNPKLQHFENSLNFSFSIPSFYKFTNVEYQYSLEGFYDSWSDWQKETAVNFGNLPSGKYTFKVRGKVGDRITENEEQYEFTILKPWYYTNIMIVVYVLIFISLFIIINRAYIKYYTRERNRAVKRRYRKLRIENLEQEQELLQTKNENLQLDVDNKNRELGMSTMNLIKKNEILNNIKKELSVSDGPAHIKYVIKLIDKSLNDTDDWKLFEEAFNNADKDFFKKIKQLHPNLTPNDLRLCAYLRLNLTSKEIAPLLNISVKSVEVKRYRLRKKMNLAHDSSLSKYIFEL